MRGRPTGIAFAEYTDEYKEICKQAWYSAGRPTNAITWMEITPEEEAHQRKPGIELLRKWKRERMWDFWADELDSEAMAIARNSLVQEKANMFERHAKKAWEWQDVAWEYIKEHGFDSSASAVQAYFKAVENERISRGISKMIVDMAEMDNGQLKDEIMRMINRASENDQIVDVDQIPEKKENDSKQLDALTE